MHDVVEGTHTVRNVIDRIAELIGPIDVEVWAETAGVDPDEPRPDRRILAPVFPDRAITMANKMIVLEADGAISLCDNWQEPWREHLDELGPLEPQQAAPRGPAWPADVSDVDAFRLSRLACEMLTGDGYVDLITDDDGAGRLIVDVAVEGLTPDDVEMLVRLFGPGISVD